MQQKYCSRIYYLVMILLKKFTFTRCHRRRRRHKLRLCICHLYLLYLELITLETWCLLTAALK